MIDYIIASMFYEDAEEEDSEEIEKNKARKPGRGGDGRYKEHR